MFTKKIPAVLLISTSLIASNLFISCNAADDSKKTSTETVAPAAAPATTTPAATPDSLKATAPKVDMHATDDSAKKAAPAKKDSVVTPKKMEQKSKLKAAEIKPVHPTT